jgi:hypothetical protein
LKGEHLQAVLTCGLLNLLLAVVNATDLCYVWLDSPAILLHASFYDESGFDIYLRKNMTVKCVESYTLSDNEKHGKYRISGDPLILESIHISYCPSVVNNTILFEKESIYSRLKSNRCGISDTRMYIQKTV